jgi:hypothetical protein
MKKGLAIAVAALAMLQGTALYAQELTREQIVAGSAAERDRELKLLGIAAMRPTVSARPLSAPDITNYDEAKANPFPKLPELLVTNAGQKVTTADQWWKVRRPEIAEFFSREVYGRVPANVPAVRWHVVEEVEDKVGDIPVLIRKLQGHADNSAYPALSVDIMLHVTLPLATEGKKKVPVVMAIGSVFPRQMGPAGAYITAQPRLPSPMAQVLKRGWAYAALDTNSIQPDNGASFSRGIIGLTNKGQPRTLDQWGSLRAHAWGVSRAIDYFETDKDIDAKKVAIFGASRTGKGALVAQAFEPRVALAQIASSGAGGVNLYRRNYGEGIPNILAANEFHWFAGNFLKYGAVGKTADDLPGDAHQMVALIAPRPTYIAGGALMLSPPEVVPGDAWQDTYGMFKSLVAASPAWKLLGKQGLETDQFPPMETFLGKGDIGFRQHPYGHTAAPNWPTFLDFAAKYFN